MNSWQVITRLYESEINVGMQADWDNGIRYGSAGPDGTIGNAMISHRTFDPAEFQDVATWLDDEARRLFPKSNYACARKT